MNRDPAAGPPEGLRAHLDGPLPEELEVGRGRLVRLTGACWHPRADVRALRVTVDGAPRARAVAGLGRPDVLLATDPAADPAGRAARAGFAALVPLAPGEVHRAVALGLEARLADGTTLAAALGAVRLVPRRAVERARLPGRRPGGGRPLVAICLATYDPPLDLLEIQLASIAAQTHRDFICIVSDDASPAPKVEALLRLTAGDPRFQVFRNERRLGFRGNFEACLARVPEGVDRIALSDQDDRWYPDKLARCLAAFRPGVELVYSDMRVVSRDDRVLSETFWTWRRNDPEDLGALLLVNCVTGAASVFRASLLDALLPFPGGSATPFHDHWIACAALTRGSLAYVDAPLYDYRQHGSNALGQPTRREVGARAWALGLWARARTGAGLVGAARGEVGRLVRAYYHDALGAAELARTLRLRFPDAAPRKARALARAARLDGSLAAAGRLALEERLGPGSPLGVGPRLLGAAASVRAHAAYHRLVGARMRRRQVALAAAGAAHG
jgi:glycosyltransferase involved in cell wall biosynthesis